MVDDQLFLLMEVPPADMQGEVTIGFDKLIIGGVEVKDGSEAYNAPAKGETTEIFYNVHLGQLSKDYGSGSTFKFKLPPALLTFDSTTLSGTKSKDIGGQVIDYEYEADVSTKEVTVTILTELE